MNFINYASSTYIMCLCISSRHSMTLGLFTHHHSMNGKDRLLCQLSCIRNTSICLYDSNVATSVIRKKGNKREMEVKPVTVTFKGAMHKFVVSPEGATEHSLQ